MALNKIRKDLDSLKDQVKPVHNEEQQAAAKGLTDALIQFSRLEQGSPEESEALYEVQQATKKFEEAGRR